MALLHITWNRRPSSEAWYVKVAAKPGSVQVPESINYNTPFTQARLRDLSQASILIQAQIIVITTVPKLLLKKTFTIITDAPVIDYD